MRRPVEMRVVRDERPPTEWRSTTGWRPSTICDLVAVVHVRLRVVVDRRRLGQRGQRVERGQRARRVLDARRLRGDLGAQPLEQLDLPLEDPLVGAEHLLLVLLQRRRDVALAAGDRLLALVVGRHGVQVRLRDLDVVAEDPVVADLERGDAGPRALLLLHLRDDLLARPADRAQFVERRVEAVADEAAVAGERRRLVDERRFDGRAHLRHVVQFGGQASEERRLQLLEDHPDPRDRAERLLQRDEVAGTGRPEHGPRHEPLEVLDGLQRLAELAALGRLEREVLDGVEPVPHALERQQRAAAATGAAGARPSR